MISKKQSLLTLFIIIVSIFISIKYVQHRITIKRAKLSTEMVAAAKPLELPENELKFLNQNLNHPNIVYARLVQYHHEKTFIMLQELGRMGETQDIQELKRRDELIQKMSKYDTTITTINDIKKNMK